MSLPQAVLFDLDGTLLDSEYLWLNAETKTMSTWNIPWTRFDQEICLGGPLERVASYMSEMIADARAEDAPTAEEISDLLILNVLDLFQTSPITWRPGARELVIDVHERDIPTAIVTASWRILLDAVLDGMRSQVGEFSVSVAGDEVIHSKPDPFPYHEAARQLGVQIQHCLVFEDSPTGTASGVASGAKTISIEHLTPIHVPGSINVETLEGQNVQEFWSLALGGSNLTKGFLNE